MNDLQLQRGNELKAQIDQLEGYILIIENATMGVQTQGNNPVEIRIPNNYSTEAKGWLKAVTHSELSKFIDNNELARIANVARFMVLQQLHDKLKELKDQYEKN
jgi:hypothetical protein